MYNLLLVDDEESILDGLYKNVEWEEAEMAGVFRASDSESALAVLESARIDVIVTDIRMPGLSGLEMSAVVRGRWPMTKIILLSGHREFDYAHRALEMGVFAYHLKPVSYEKLLDSVRKAGHAIGEELRQVGVLHKAEERVRAASSLIVERLLTRWIVHGIPMSGEELALASSCGLRIASEKNAFMAMFRLDEKDEDHGAAVDYATVSLFLPDLIAGILAGDWRPTVFSDRPGSFILLVHGESEPLPGDMRRRFESAVDAIQESLRKTLGWLCTIIWGEAEPLSQAGKSYQELVKREKTQLLMEPGALIGPGCGSRAAADGCRAVTAGAGGGANIESLCSYPDMRTLVQSGQRQLLEARIRAVFAELAEKAPASGERLLEIYHLAVGALVSDSMSRGVELSAWSDGLEDFLLSYGSINSTKELQEKCLRATGQYFDALAQAGTFRKSVLVEEIMAYVKGNIACRLSVSSITEHFFYNASYLTRIFKKETGYSIGDYIIKQRMEHARELLAIPGKKAGDVCLEVGYESFPHFSRIFKKWYGASPKHFIQPS